MVYEILITNHPTLQLVNSIGVEVRSKGQCLGGDGVFTKLVRHSFPTKCILLETISHKFTQMIFEAKVEDCLRS